MVRWLTCSVISLLSALPCALAAEIPVVAPATVGLSQDRLERITSVLAEHVAEDRIAGGVALIARRGEIGYFEPFGMKDREAGTPMRRDTIFRIYSMTKPVTSVGVMMLYEEGRFSLHDPVSRFLPELGGLRVAVEEIDPVTGEAVVRYVPAESEITIRELLTHTSGLTYEFGGQTAVHRLYSQAFAKVGEMDLEEAVKLLGTLPLRFQPGTAWDYSRATDVLGRLIEVVSGKGLDEFFRQRIFDPLEMVDTGFWVPEDTADRLAALYTRRADGTVALSPSPAKTSYFKPPKLLSGGGGLVSTARDYLRFCQMMLDGGQLDGARLLSPRTVALMTQDHLNGIPVGMGFEGSGFGLGFLVFPRPGVSGDPTSAGSYSWGGAASTRFWIDPAQQLIGVFLIQILPDRGVTYGDQFRRMTYASIVE
jgi:CubicO group peptidase (beta-lactamase class C family)